jgi:hypothetical protein
MKDARDLELEAHDKEVKRLKKKIETVATEETKGLTAERDALVKELTRLKVFDPEDKPVTWSSEQMREIERRCNEFVIACSRFIMDDRLDEHVEVQGQVIAMQTRCEHALRDLVERFNERFVRSFGE